MADVENSCPATAARCRVDGTFFLIALARMVYNSWQPHDVMVRILYLSNGIEKDIL